VAAITISGYIASTVVPGSLDAFNFYNFIAEDVVSHILGGRQLTTLILE